MSIKISISGGKKLKRFADKIKSQFKSMQPGVEAGFFSGSTYEDGTPVAQVAMENEYGNPLEHRPPRPFMRLTIEREQKKWSQILGVALKSSNYNIATALTQVGGSMQQDIKDTIKNATSYGIAPNSPKTAALKNKGRDKDSPSQPLIDTGLMVKSVQYQVKGTSGNND